MIIFACMGDALSLMNSSGKPFGQVRSGLILSGPGKGIGGVM
jgi:hypothetical protein